MASERSRQQVGMTIGLLPLDDEDAAINSYTEGCQTVGGLSSSHQRVHVIFNHLDRIIRYGFHYFIGLAEIAELSQLYN